MFHCQDGVLRVIHFQFVNFREVLYFVRIFSHMRSECLELLQGYVVVVALLTLSLNSRIITMWHFVKNTKVKIDFTVHLRTYIFIIEGLFLSSSHPPHVDQRASHPGAKRNGTYITSWRSSHDLRVGHGTEKTQV